MSRKVLISFVGTGRLLDRQTREYDKATYMVDGQKYESPFVSVILKKHFKIDSVILIGTAKSIWESVYLEFSKENGKDFDEDYFLALGLDCEGHDHTSPLEILHQERIEDAMGPGSKIVLINYGLNQEEFQKNEEKILSIEQFLKDGDELYVDITHCFRSLPLVLLNTIIYLKEVSSKNITIQKILYGMLDVNRELGYAPIVELNNVLEVNEWISGAHALKEYGNGYKIAELLKDQKNKTTLNTFSDLLNANYLNGIKNELDTTINYSVESPLAKKVLKPVMDSFKKILHGRSDSEYQLSLAEWHFNHCNYGSSYLILQETIITYMCERHSEFLPDDARQARDLIRGLFNNQLDQIEVKRLKEKIGFIDRKIWDTYHQIREIRNGIAHPLGGSHSIESIIKTLGNSIRTMKEFIIGKDITR